MVEKEKKTTKNLTLSRLS